MAEPTTHGCGHDHAHDNEPDMAHNHIDADMPTPPPPSDEDLVDIVLTHAGKTWTISLPPSATVEDIALVCESELSSSSSSSSSSADTDNGSTDAGSTDASRYSVTKLIAPPPVGLLHIANAAHARLTIDELQQRLVNKKSASSSAKQAPPPPSAPIKLRVMASSVSSVAALQHWSATAAARAQRLRDLRRRAVPARTTPNRLSGSDNNGGYTFGDIKPLPYLPHPERSLAYLHRLRDDVGIRRVMRAHKYRVGLLTEMDPRQYTQADMDGVTRVLGLNRNNGQVIELRLRTDDVGSGGYRDYKTVRLTLCHELAHNIHSAHDKHFWALYRQLVKEVGAADYIGNGGRVLLDGGREGQYAPARGGSDEDDDEGGEDDIGHVDGGGWTGGTFVLGSGPITNAAASSSAAAAASSSTPSAAASNPLTERERRARAAEERLRRMNGGAGGSN